MNNLKNEIDINKNNTINIMTLYYNNKSSKFLSIIEESPKNNLKKKHAQLMKDSYKSLYKKIKELYNNLYKKNKLIIKNKKNIFVNIGEMKYYSYIKNKNRYNLCRFFKDSNFTKMTLKAILIICESLVGIPKQKKIKKLNKYVRKFVLKNKFKTIEFDNKIIHFTILINKFIDEIIKFSNLSEIMLLLNITVVYLSVIFGCTHHYKFRGDLAELKKIKLDDCFNNNIGRYTFLAFSKFNHNSENLNFYIDYFQYKQILIQDYRNLVGINMIKKYIKSGSINELNISHNVKNKLLKINKFKQNSYDQIYKEIRNLIQMNIFINYISKINKFYTELCSENNIIIDILTILKKVEL